MMSINNRIVRRRSLRDARSAEERYLAFISLTAQTDTLAIYFSCNRLSSPEMAVATNVTTNFREPSALIAVILEKTMRETGTERENIWGPIAMANWRETPCIRGRIATEDDANAGRAVFYLSLSEGQESHPVDLDLPRCAILHEEGEGDLPVIVIQAEEGNNGTVQLIAGYRPLTGGSGICMLNQLELLAEPDHRFAESAPTTR